MAAIEVERDEKRRARRERKARKLWRLQTMHRMQDNGHAPREIAVVLGFANVQAYNLFRRNNGVETPSWASCRKLGFHVHSDVVAGVWALADRAEVSVGEILRTTLEILTAEDNRVAIKILGAEGLPKGKRTKYRTASEGPR